MSGAVRLRVPGSTSNLGAGFDCVGIAIDRWLTLTARLQPGADGPLRITRRGTLANLALSDEDDLLSRGFAAACRAAGTQQVPRGIVDAASDIPIGRGLGSSGAAVVAGALAARALLRLRLDDEALLGLCAELEGHADNVAPAIYGEAVLAVRGSDGRLTVAALEVHRAIVLVFAVPEFAVVTERARAALPQVVSHATAQTAAARAAALVAGLAAADPALLGAGLDDVLHVPYRRALVPGYDAVSAAARAAGAFGATLSGSGSAILALAPVRAADAVAGAMARAWHGAGVSADVFQVSRPAGRAEMIPLPQEATA